MACGRPGCGCQGGNCKNSCSGSTNLPDVLNLVVPADTWYSDDGEADCTDAECADRNGTFPLTKVAADETADCSGSPLLLARPGTLEAGTCLYVSEFFEACLRYESPPIEPPVYSPVDAFWYWQAQIIEGRVTVYLANFCLSTVYYGWSKDFGTNGINCAEDITGIERDTGLDLDAPQHCVTDDSKELSLEIPP